MATYIGLNKTRSATMYHLVEAHEISPVYGANIVQLYILTGTARVPLHDGTTIDMDERYVKGFHLVAQYALLVSTGRVVAHDANGFFHGLPHSSYNRLKSTPVVASAATTSAYDGTGGRGGCTSGSS